MPHRIGNVIPARGLTFPPDHWGSPAVVWRKSQSPARIAVLGSQAPHYPTWQPTPPRHRQARRIALTTSTTGPRQRIAPAGPSRRRAIVPTRPSLPLDGARGLARAVEHHPVDLRDGVGDPAGDACQDVVRQVGPVRGHSVLTADRPQNNGVAVGAPVALHPHGAHVGQQHHRALPDLVVEPGAGSRPSPRR